MEETLTIAYFLDGDLQAPLMLASLLTATKSDDRIRCIVFFSKQVSQEYVKAAMLIDHVSCMYLPDEYDVILRKLDSPACGPYAMARVFLPYLLKANWCMYLDVDTIVNPNRSFVDYVFGVFNREESKPPEEQKLTYGCLDPAVFFRKDNEYCSTHEYVNSGVLLFNLSEMRKTHFPEKAISTFLKPPYKLKFHDQDIISYLSRGRLGYIPFTMNCMFPAKTMPRKYFELCATYSKTEEFIYRDKVGSDWFNEVNVFHLSGSSKPYYCFNEIGHFVYDKYARKEVDELLDKVGFRNKRLYVSVYVGGDSATRAVASIRSLMSGIRTSYTVSYCISVASSNEGVNKAVFREFGDRATIKMMKGMSEEDVFSNDLKDVLSYKSDFWITVDDSVYLYTDLPVESVVYAMSPFTTVGSAYLGEFDKIKYPTVKLYKPRDKYTAGIPFENGLKDDEGNTAGFLIQGFSPVLWRINDRFEKLDHPWHMILPNNCLQLLSGKKKSYPFFKDIVVVSKDPVGDLFSGKQMVERQPNQCFSSVM